MSNPKSEWQTAESAVMPDRKIFSSKAASLPAALSRWLSARLTISAQIATGTTLLSLMTIITIGTLSLRSFKNNLNDVLLAQQNTLITRIANDLDQKLLTLQRALIGSAKTVKANNIASAEEAQHYLDGNTGLHALFDRSIFLFSTSGKIIAEHPFLPNRRGQDFSWRGYIKDTINTNKPVISEPFITTKDDHNVVLMLTAPVFSSNGQLMTILTGSLGLTRPAMLGDIAKTVIGQHGYLYLVTADGQLIIHPDRTRLSKRAFTPGANPLFDRALNGYEGTGQTIESDGKKVLTTYKHIPSTGWIIAAVYPEEEAFAPFNILVQQFIEVLVIACTFTLISVWCFTRGLVGKLSVLVAKLQSANKELETMRADAAYKLQTRSQFFQEASHDFRQRLHAMQLLAHTAERSTLSDDSRLLPKLSYAITDLQIYVKRFLEFAKLERAATNPVLNEIHLQDIFQILELEFEHAAHEKKVDLRIWATNICLNTDEQMLLRILANLVSNAIKFTRGKVLVGARKRVNGISIEVWDNGPGIPASDQDAIFEAFYQGVSYPDPQQKGIGLGLSIVRRLADCLSYAVSVSAQQGRGSVVKVLIPLRNEGVDTYRTINS